MSLFRNITDEAESIAKAADWRQAIPDVQDHPLVVSAREALAEAKAAAQAEIAAMTDVERRLEALEARQGIRPVRERDQRVADAEAALKQAESDAAAEIRVDCFEPAYERAVRRLSAALEEASAANKEVLDLFLESEGLKRHGGRPLPELHWAELNKPGNGGESRISHWRKFAGRALGIDLESVG